MNLSVHQISPKPLQLESWNLHIVQVLPRQRSNSFQNQFYCPFDQFYLKNVSESGHRVPQTSPDKRGQFGAAIWQINLYYIIFSTNPYSTVGRGGSAVRARDWQSRAHGFESHWGRLETFAISFIPLCQCLFRHYKPLVPYCTILPDQ